MKKFKNQILEFILIRQICADCIYNIIYITCNISKKLESSIFQNTCKLHDSFD